MSDKRLFQYDLLRTIAVLCIVCVHCMAGYENIVDPSTLQYFIKTIYDSVIKAGVPLFVLLSGALLLGKDEPVSVFYKKRLRKLLIPFFTWSLIVYTIHFFQEGRTDCFISGFAGQFLTSGVHGIYWFVYMIIGLYLITPILRKFVCRADPKFAAYTMAVLWAVYYLSNLFSSFEVTHRFASDNLIHIAYFISGFYLSEQFCERRKVIRVAALSILSLSWLSYVVCGCSGVEPDILESYFTPLIAMSLFCLVCSGDTCHDDGSPYVKAVTYLSSISFGIYLSHFILISVLGHLDIVSVPLTVRPLLILFAVVLIESVMFKIIRKCRLGFIFG